MKIENCQNFKMSNPATIYTPQTARIEIEKPDGLIVSNPGFRKPKAGETTSFGKPNIRLNSKPLRIAIKGKMHYFSDQDPNEYKDHKTFSLGVEFLEEDLEALDLTMTKLGQHLKPGSGWVQKYPHESGSVFFKLPTNKTHDAFTFTSNAIMTPDDQYDASEVIRNSGNMVTVDFTVGAYALHDTKLDSKTGKEKKMYGLTLAINKLTWEVPKKPVVKRVKTDSDTEKPKPKKRVKKAVPPPPPKSEEVVESDDDEDDEE